MKKNDTKYVLLEFYHKNPLKLANKTDSSGIRLYLTPDNFEITFKSHDIIHII